MGFDILSNLSVDQPIAAAACLFIGEVSYLDLSVE